ncbi:MAG: SDR family NAD(P)-dependent oxidoreductase [Calditrichaeota bacterium]|nr:MAG: SDR family NAD(P)-dependent oxidoreductase [Calditrichota bacterium]
MSLLKDKTVFITGASSGIGAACARAFAAEGCRLILLARRGERLAALEAELKVPVRTITADVRDRKALETALKSVDEVDVLVNNAGLALGTDKLHEAAPEDHDTMIDTNVKGVLNINRILTPRMIRRGHGDIIHIGSIAGHEVYPGGSVYCASKHAVDALVKGLRMDVVDTPLRVSSIDPGLVETEFSVVRFHGDAHRADQVYRGLEPLIGDDIAAIAVFIASRPPHVQIADVVVFPTAQASATVVHRSE